MKYFCISLDFEIRWGMRHLLKGDPNGYREDLEMVREAVPALSELFRHYSFATTWATVGALALNSWEEFFDCIPDSFLRSVGGFKTFEDETSSALEHLYFAPDIVTRLANEESVELASHTFTHLFALEPGTTREDFVCDANWLARTFEQRGLRPPSSLVYPRNQIAFVEDMMDLGIKKVRYNQRDDQSAHNTVQGNTFFRRADRYLRNSNPFGKTSAAVTPMGTRASMFFNPNLPAPLWNLHLSRIRRELRGLRDGECFHIWWHPHNMRRDLRNNMERTRSMLDALKSAEDVGVKNAQMINL